MIAVIAPNIAVSRQKVLADLVRKVMAEKPEKKIWSREENREKANNKNYSASKIEIQNAQMGSVWNAIQTALWLFDIPDNSNLPDVLMLVKGSMNGVMTNDKIEVQIQARRRSLSRWTHSRVVSRETKTVFRQALLKLEFCLERNDLKVKNGDWVTARILTYPEHMRGFQGEVEAVIGDLAELTQRMIIYVFSAAAGNSPHVFTKETLREAELKTWSR